MEHHHVRAPLEVTGADTHQERRSRCLGRAYILLTDRGRILDAITVPDVLPQCILTGDRTEIVPARGLSVMIRTVMLLALLAPSAPLVAWALQAELDPRGSGVARPGELCWKFTTGGQVWGAITMAKGVGYFGSQDSAFYAVELSTGRERWRIRTGAGNSAGPKVAGETVYVGSGDGHFYALDAGTGRELWRLAAGGRIVGTPAVAGGAAYFGSDDGQLYAIDLNARRELWRFATGSRVTSPPTVGGRGLLHQP